MCGKKDKGETELLTSYWRQWVSKESFRDMGKMEQMGMHMKSIDLNLWKHNLDTYEMDEEEEKYSRTERKLDTLLKDDSIPMEKRRKAFKKLITQKWKLLQSTQRKKIEVFAKKHKLKFDESKKEQIINEIIKRHGFCQSKREQTKENTCPCIEALEKIMKRGKCRHGLFIAAEDIRPETKKLDSGYWGKEEGI